MAKTTTIVIFGASGDLAHRKLIPALFHLYLKNRLPEQFLIYGTATRLWDDETFRSTCHASLIDQHPADLDETAWQKFSSRMTYHPGDFSADQTYLTHRQNLEQLEGKETNRIYYLATPPEFFPAIIRGLADQQLLDETQGWRRVVIEKPFGVDYSSARELNNFIHSVLDENQIFRIDHYLGKETVQNILVARFANTIFEPVWNRNYIENVQITVAETVGVESRGKYYDKAGVIRDMFQNHLMQLLTLVAMEPSSSYKAEALRDEKVKVISAIRPIKTNEIYQNAILGQYSGYRSEANVAENSKTPTFAALRFFIDNWRWQGVPFYLRSGKRMTEKRSEIIIQFKTPPHMIFANCELCEAPSNLLSLRLQPDEGIHLRFEAKVPDTLSDTRSVNMDYSYLDEFGPKALPEAYERLLLDVINGDASLFTRADQTEISWELFDPIIQRWEAPDSPNLYSYQQGSFGPTESDQLLADKGHHWINNFQNQ